TAEATARDGAIAESMVDASLSVEGVVEAGKLTTLTGSEALLAGIAEARAATLEELVAEHGAMSEPITVIEQSWAESMVRFLTSSTISGLLMSLGMLGLFFELMSPGFGWAGAMGITMLVLFFTGQYLVHLAGLEEMLLFLVGIILLALEILVIPGFGVAGVLGILAVGTSLVLALVSADIDIAISTGALEDALLRVLLSLLGTVLGAVLLFKFLPRTRVGRRLVLQERLASGGSVGFGTDGVEAPGIGETGVALTDLKPFGHAKIGGRRLEVVSDGGYLSKGDTIRISRISGSRIEVRPAVTRPAEGEASA
ncbi:MAG: hypothetical protein KC561_21040, partial [Myxococcales bacterium]|nr:hypothetical protein [Myxococcales bacterium]